MYFSLFTFLLAHQHAAIFSIIENEIAKTYFTLVGFGYSHAYCQDRMFGNTSMWSSLIVILIQVLLFVVFLMWTRFYMVERSMVLSA
jgi:hypothetical protein